MSGLQYRISVLTHGIFYGLRRLVSAPATDGERCVMGSPVHPWMWCPRVSEANELWCEVHRQDEGGSE